MSAGGSESCPAMDSSVVLGGLFHCSICLDLVYKPIVQSCGHMFCFWCARRAMDSRRHSQCPVCRRPYTHFRRVCEMLHFFLMQAAREEYSRRAQEIQDMEQRFEVFSPHIQESPRSNDSPRKEANSERGNIEKQPGSRRPLSSNQKDLVSVNQKASADAKTMFCKSDANPSRECLYLERTVDSAAEKMRKEFEYDEQTKRLQDADGLENELSVESFLCASCNKFLYRPVVLDCGQVFCESCVETSSPLLSCPSCREAHPGGPVQVCLELHYYLKRAFPAKYLKRKEEVSSRQVSSESKTTHMGSDSANEMSHREPGMQLVHVRVGCDGCGMFPIVGDWYHCLDCAEKIGYDLCGGCHRKGIPIAGRFNQQHKKDHRMQLDQSRTRRPSNLVTLNMENSTIQRLHQPILTFHDFDHSIPGLI